MPAQEHTPWTPEEIAAITGGDPEGIRIGMGGFKMVDADGDADCDDSE
ncbi:hypothetical protein [Haladaptatus sp. CMAA 1909]